MASASAVIRKVRSSDGTGASLGDAFDAEDRMAGRDAPQVGVGGLRSDAAEECADLPFPALEVVAQDRNLVVVGQPGRSEALSTPTEQKAALASGTEVADPLRVPAWRDEVAGALESQEVDRTARTPRPPAAPRFPGPTVVRTTTASISSGPMWVRTSSWSPVA